MYMKIFLIDAFTDVPFKGNPAYVCLLDDDFPAEKKMQNIAFELGMSETVFLRKNLENYDIRWFTPQCEVPLCGHGTLSAAYVLFKNKNKKEMIFNSKSGILKAIVEDNDDIILEFPIKDYKKVDIIPEFIEILGAVPEDIFEGEDFFLCYFKDKDLIQLEPDFVKMKNTTLKDIIVTTESTEPKLDFVSRVFAPGCGIDEDPVTGSAHTVLAPFWQSRLGKNKFNSMQLSQRTGKLKLEIVGKILKIQGSCVEILSGEINL